MEILLRRIARRPTYTIGRLYIDGRYFCDTVEDTDRDLNRNGRFDNGEAKVYAQTAIPNGRYRVTMNVRSPKFSSRTEYNWWRRAASSWGATRWWVASPTPWPRAKNFTRYLKPPPTATNKYGLQ